MNVRSAASSALAEVAKAAPALAEQVIEPLRAAAKDSDLECSVRMAASSALGEVVKAAPGAGRASHRATESRCQGFRSWSVRSAASRALAEVAKAAPALAEQVLEPLIAASKDEYSYVRSCCQQKP